MHVQSFDSWDDMQAAMQKAEDAANERITGIQRAIRDRMDAAVHWVRAVPEWDLVIYGAVPSLIEGDEDALDRRRRGYLTGLAYSSVEPEGEAGDTHVSEVVPISGAVFGMAQAAGFPDFTALREAKHQGLAKKLMQAESANIDSRNG